MEPTADSRAEQSVVTKWYNTRQLDVGSRCLDRFDPIPAPGSDEIKSLAEILTYDLHNPFRKNDVSGHLLVTSQRRMLGGCLRDEGSDSAGAVGGVLCLDWDRSEEVEACELVRMEK